MLTLARAELTRMEVQSRLLEISIAYSIGKSFVTST